VPPLGGNNLAGGSGDGPNLNFLWFLLPLALLGAAGWVRHNGVKRRYSEFEGPGEVPGLAAPPGTMPELVGGPAPPPAQRLIAPAAQTRAPAGPVAPGLVVGEAASKYRWDVQVGNYFWKRGAGAGGASRVDWGRKGGTSSTPIVMKQMVTIQDAGGAAPARNATPAKKVVKAMGMGGASRPSGAEMTSVDVEPRAPVNTQFGAASLPPTCNAGPLEAQGAAPAVAAAI